MFHSGMKEAVTNDTDDTYKIYQQPSTLEHHDYKDANQPTKSPVTAHTQLLQHGGKHTRQFGIGWLIAAAIVGAVLVGTAVGGGLGAQYASCNDKLESQANNVSAEADQLSSELQTCSTNSSNLQTSLNNCLAGNSISSTDYAALAPTDVQSLKDSCQNGTTYAIPNCPKCTKGAVYTRVCNTQILPGIRGARGKLSHLLGIMAYTVEDCIGACDNYNQQQVWSERQYPDGTGEGMWCYSVTWLPNMSEQYESYGGNCWLKNDTLASLSDARNADGSVSAILLSDAVYS